MLRSFRCGRCRAADRAVRSPMPAWPRRPETRSGLGPSPRCDRRSRTRSRLRQSHASRAQCTRTWSAMDCTVSTPGRMARAMDSPPVSRVCTTWQAPGSGRLNPAIGRSGIGISPDHRLWWPRCGPPPPGRRCARAGARCPAPFPPGSRAGDAGAAPGCGGRRAPADPARTSSAQKSSAARIGRIRMAMNSIGMLKARSRRS